LTSLRRLFLSGMRDHLAYSDALLSVVNFHTCTLQHVNVGLLGACGGVAGPRLEEFLDHLVARVTTEGRVLARGRRAVHDRALDAAALYATLDEARAAVAEAAAASRVFLRHPDRVKGDVRRELAGLVRASFAITRRLCAGAGASLSGHDPLGNERYLSGAEMGYCAEKVAGQARSLGCVLAQYAFEGLAAAAELDEVGLAALDAPAERDRHGLGVAAAARELRDRLGAAAGRRSLEAPCWRRFATANLLLAADLLERLEASLAAGGEG
jgi:hypothetical protein